MTKRTGEWGLLFHPDDPIPASEYDVRKVASRMRTRANEAQEIKDILSAIADLDGWRGETDTEDKIQKRVEHDLYYIENWSVLLDLYILLKTRFSLLTKNENAY